LGSLLCFALGWDWEWEWECFSVFICDCLLDGEAGQEDTQVIFPRTMYKRCRRVLRLFAAAILEPFGNAAVFIYFSNIGLFSNLYLKNQ
jgi:hypothetical protein